MILIPPNVTTVVLHENGKQTTYINPIVRDWKAIEPGYISRETIYNDYVNLYTINFTFDKELSCKWFFIDKADRDQELNNIIDKIKEGIYM